MKVTASQEQNDQNIIAKASAGVPRAAPKYPF